MPIAHVSYGERNGWDIFHIGGELDLSGVTAVRERLHAVIWGGCLNLVVDLSRLDFCDSTGFAVLIAARRHMAARDGEIRLVLPAAGSAVRDILIVFGTHRLFAVYESAAEAVSPPADALPDQEVARAEVQPQPRRPRRLRPRRPLPRLPY